MPIYNPAGAAGGTPIGISTQGNTSGTTGFATVDSYQFVGSNLLKTCTCAACDRLSA